jgi:hypothetical protein
MARAASNAELAVGASLSATAFLTRPTVKRSKALLAVTQLTPSTRSISGTRKEERTIGPESRCGKSVNEARNERRLRGGSYTRRWTSTR